MRRPTALLLATALGLIILTTTPPVPQALAATPFIANVRSYGATGNGKTLDTKAINRAIAAAVAKGGGIVEFPSGNYLSLSIHLKSNITLQIDKGATIIAATGTYDAAEPNKWGDKGYQDFGYSHWHNSLIWGENLENIAITGSGKIYGKGLTHSSNPPAGAGNKAIALKLCKNVILRDFTIRHGGHFGLLATGVDNMSIDNLKIDTDRDGMDIDSCRFVRIGNCSVNAPEDDAICLKSSYALGFPRACDHVAISTCQVSGYDEGTFLDGTLKRNASFSGGVTGRIKLGTESNGGFRNIDISNCKFTYSRGLALETVDGGILEDVNVSNLTMQDIVNAPIYLRLGARMRGPSGVPVGALRRVTIRNVTAHHAAIGSSIIAGIPGHMIEDVTLDNVHIDTVGGGTSAMAATEPPELITAKPEPSSHGPMPAYGFFIRHAANIVMNDVGLTYVKRDVRPPFVLEQVNIAAFSSVTARHDSAAPTFILRDVNHFSTSNVQGVPDVQKSRISSGKY